MQNSTIIKCDTASNRGETGQIGKKNSLKIIVTGALLLAATSAMAGLLSSPMGMTYSSPELAAVEIQNIGDGTVQIRTTGLTGELNLNASDVPPEIEPPAMGCARFPFEQHLELVINLSQGVVEGPTRGHISTRDGTLDYHAEVRGNATCVPSGGRRCGQLVVDLEMRGALADPNNPASVGKMRMEMLGSLIWDDTDMLHWAAMSANATLGGNEMLLNSLLETMEEEECGL